MRIKDDDGKVWEIDVVDCYGDGGMEFDPLNNLLLRVMVAIPLLAIIAALVLVAK